MKVLDKQEYRLKAEEMHQLMREKKYEEAREKADLVDWKKVKNIAMLYAASEVYESNKDYEKARDILFMAYDKSPESKKIVYKLAILAIKMGEIKEAVDCYEEFIALAPKDPNGFVLKYKILRAKKAPIEEQIATLEEFKKVEYVEKWAYELAVLYREAGMITECLEECDDLIVWFSEGKYIYKAMELKMNYKPLTPIQHEKYLNRPDAKPIIEEQPKQEEVEVQEQSMQEEVEVQEEPMQEEVEVQEEPMQEEVEVQEEPMQQESVEKPNLSIEEMVQDWQETQKENAQMIQAELQRVEQEKAEIEAQKEEDSEEQKEEILSNEVRKLMEELEAESAEIDASKIAKEETEPENEKPLLQKVVEQLSALDVKIEFPVKEVDEEPEELEIPVNNQPIELEEEEEGLKLGDTQSMALAAKAVAEAAAVEVPQVQIPTVTIPVTPVQQFAPGDTGFVVQGKYDLDARADIGTRAGLTEEQKELFSYFVPVHGMSEQLVKVLHDDKECTSRYGTSRIGNVVIVGRKGSGKTVLAVDIVKAIQKQRRIKNGKVAIVKAESLNKKDVNEIVQKLNGGALVIEKASRLKRKTIEDLCEMMEGQTGELLVVLEDERKPIDKMLSEYPNFAKKFTSRVELPVFINDELVTFGQTYAKENGYKIDEMGILALYSDIDILQREDKVVTVSDVKAIIDDAIETANKPSLKKFVKKILGRNTDKSRRVILKEEHFR